MSSGVRRVVTGHDSGGKAVVLMDGVATNVRFREASKLTSTLLWVTDETPAKVSSHADRADRQIGVAPPGGRICSPHRRFPSGYAGRRLLSTMKP